MEFPLKNAATGSEELKTMKENDFLRLFKLNSLRETDNTSWDSLTLIKTNELNFFSGQWKTYNKNAVESFSAVAYYFGKKIQEQENIPIGLIQIDVGGSPIESWIDRYTMEHDNLLVDMLNNWRKSDFIMPWVRERADTNLKYASSAFFTCTVVSISFLPLLNFIVDIDMPLVAGGDPPKQTCSTCGIAFSFCSKTCRLPITSASLKFHGVFRITTPSFRKPRSLFKV